MCAVYHEREDDGDALDGLDSPQAGEAEDLDAGEDVAAAQGHVAQEDVVRLVLGRHEDDHHTLHQLWTRTQCTLIITCSYSSMNG